MSEAEYSQHFSQGVQHQNARRPATLARITGTTIAASLLYGVTGNWSWGSTIETAPDGRPITDVQIGGSASGWFELVILVLGVAAFVLSRQPKAFQSVRHTTGVAGLSADRLLSWMWLFVAAVWVFSILQALIAVLLVEHQIMPPLLINGTVHIRHH